MKMLGVAMSAALLLGLCLFWGTPTAQGDFVFGEAVNLGPRLNSSAVEGTPVMPADGLSIFFDSNRSGGSGGYDVWASTRETVDGEWSVPVSLKSPVNSPAWDGVPSISPDGLTLFLSSDRPGGYGGTDLWMTTRNTKEDLWTAPVNLGPMVNSPYDEWTQSISPDGLELYFSSWKPGGIGGADLWITRRNTGEDDWSTPVNLGPTINGPSDDVNPSISADGLYLFFFSVRAGGHGSRDIWVATRASRQDGWRSPMNLGPPVNTASMDQGASFSPDGSALIFCSDRAGGYGSLDLMQVPLIPIVDFNGDEIVDIADLAILIERWGGADPQCDVGPSAWGDGVVDDRDLEVLMDHWGREILSPDLMAYWKLDEAEGVAAFDSIGARDGAAVGGPVWQPAGGKIAGALQFDGVDDCVTTGFVCNPSADPFSVFAWIRGGAPGQVILSQAKGANWLLVSAPDGELMTELKSGRGGPLLSNSVITDGTWHRVGLVWDGANRILYVDDVEVARDPLVSPAAGTGGLHIGAGSTLAPGTFWSGLIDDVRLYDRAVTP